MTIIAPYDIHQLATDLMDNACLPSVCFKNGTYKAMLGSISLSLYIERIRCREAALKVAAHAKAYGNADMEKAARMILLAIDKPNKQKACAATNRTGLGIAPSLDPPAKGAPPVSRV